MNSSANNEIYELYQELIDSWNNRDAKGMAEKFTRDGVQIGFDGSQVNGCEEILSHLEPIFENNPTPPFISKVKNIRLLEDSVAILHAIAGMVPPGESDIMPELNAQQTLVAVKSNNVWQVELFQNTPAQFHGRPELVEKMTAELRELLI